MYALVVVVQFIAVGLGWMAGDAADRGEYGPAGALAMLALCLMFSGLLLAFVLLKNLKPAGR